MSGFARADFTATPIFDFTRSDAAVGNDLALLDEVAKRVTYEDQDVGGFAALQPHRYSVGRGAHRWPIGGDHLVTSRALELRAPARYRPPKIHPRSSPGPRPAPAATVKPQDAGDAERECAQMCRCRSHDFLSRTALDCRALLSGRSYRAKRG